MAAARQQLLRRRRLERQRGRVAERLLAETGVGEQTADDRHVAVGAVVARAREGELLVVDVEIQAEHGVGLHRLVRGARVDRHVRVARREGDATVAAEHDDDAVVEALVAPRAVGDGDRHEGVEQRGRVGIHGRGCEVRRPRRRRAAERAPTRR